MNVLSALFEIMLNIFQGIMMIAFMRGVTKPRYCYNHWIDIISCFVISSILSVYSFFPVSIPDTYIIAFPFIYAIITKRGSWLQRILWTIILGAIMVYVATIMINLYDTLLGIEFDILMEPGITRTGFTITANISMAIILFTISKVSSRHANTIIPSTMSAILILLLMTQFLSAESLYLSRIYAERQDIFSMFSLVCAFVSSAITYILYEVINKTAEKRHRQEMIEQTMTINRKYQEDIGAIYDRMLIAQHDLKHQIAMAQELLQQAGITEMPEELQAAMRTSAVITTGCISADAVLTAKKAAAIKNGIDFDLELFPLNPLPINETDFCILLTNILDNAIEGAANSSPADNKKYVHLHFRRAWNMFNIICKNSADPASVRIENNRCIPLNKISGLHGLGTESIRQTVTAHSGKCDFSLRDDTFMVYIVIPDDEE